MRIGIDIDDTITQTSVNVIQWHNQKYGTSLTYEGVFTQQFRHIFEVDDEETSKRIIEWHESEHIKKLEFLEGAKEAIIELSKNHELFFITGRNPLYAAHTTNWIETHFPNLSGRIHYAFNPYRGDGGKTKMEICKELEVDFLIEDAEGYAMECVNNDITVLLLDHPWNRHIAHPKIIRVKNWKEITELLPNVR